MEDPVNGAGSVWATVENLDSHFGSEDGSLDAVTSEATVVKSGDFLALDIMKPAVVRLPQQGDEDPSTIIFENALWKYVCICDVSFQQLTDTSEDDVVHCKADHPAVN